MRMCLSDSNDAESDAENQANPPPIGCLQGCHLVAKKTDFDAGSYHLLCFEEGKKPSRNSFSAHQPIREKPYF